MRWPFLKRHSKSGLVLAQLHKHFTSLNFTLSSVYLGHLLFEMCCGYELTSVVPTEQDYKSAKKDEVKAILEFVFKAQQVEDVRTSLSVCLCVC